MHSHDEVRKLQTQLSGWRGTRTAAAWLLVANLVFLGAQIVMLVQGRDDLAELAPASSGVIILFGLLLLAKKKIQTIAHELSS